MERFSDYTEPLKSFFDKVQGWQTGRRIFLVDHSLGGLIGADYLLQHQTGLAGAVLSGPAVKPPKLSPALLVMGRLLSRLAPKMGVRGLDAGGVSRDPEVLHDVETWLEAHL